MRYLIVCGGKIDKEFGLNEIKTDGIDAIIAADSGMDFLYEICDRSDERRVV